MAQLLSAACNALHRLIDPPLAVWSTNSNSYVYPRVTRLSLRMPDPATWPSSEMKRRRQAVSDLVRENPDGVEDDLLYALCQWAEEARTDQERDREQYNCMLLQAMEDGWSLPLIKRLWGAPGTVRSPLRLAGMIPFLYTPANTADERQYNDRLLDLAIYYKEDIMRHTNNNEENASELLVRSLWAASLHHGEEERQRVRAWLDTHFPEVLAKYVASRGK